MAQDESTGAASLLRFLALKSEKPSMPSIASIDNIDSATPTIGLYSTHRFTQEPLHEQLD